MVLLPNIGGFLDELEKIALQVQGTHGTNGRWELLRPDVGSRISKTDPNRKSLYVAGRHRRTRVPVSDFANHAVESRGGTPSVAFVRMDTRKGWTPHSLSDEGRKTFGNLAAVREHIEDMDLLKGRDKASRTARGPMWKKLNRGVGSWYNPSHTATLKPRKWRPAWASHAGRAAAESGAHAGSFLEWAKKFSK